MTDIENETYYILYCPYQKSYHVESEKDFWNRTIDVFIRCGFNECAYVPIKKVVGHKESYDELKKLTEISGIE